MDVLNPNQMGRSLLLRRAVSCGSALVDPQDLPVVSQRPSVLFRHVRELGNYLNEARSLSILPGVIKLERHSILKMYSFFLLKTGYLCVALTVLELAL